MKANEIQIGDWLYYKGQFNAFPFKVESITKKKVGYHAEPGDNRIYYIQLNEVQPIPITPEILEKNGFKPYIPEYHLETVYACQDVSKAVANELYALWPYQDGSFYLLLRVDGKDMVRMNIHYVHQLQHVLRLCGIEKEIVV